MKIKFMGTGAAEGFPAVFCDCQYCKAARTLGFAEFRTRSQVLIDGVLSVDFPPDAYSHALRFNEDFTGLKFILVTHSHMDHFYAHDFILHGYKYSKGAGEITIFGNAEVKKVFAECTAREMREEVAESFQFVELKPFNEITFGDYRVLTLPAQHSKTEDCLLYYIERGGKGYLHLYDTGRIPDVAFDFLKERGAKADAVAIDCTFADKTAGEISRHMGIGDDMVMKDKLYACGAIDDRTKLIITHFSHNGNPTRARLSEIEKAYNVTAAYDGYEAEI